MYLVGWTENKSNEKAQKTNTNTCKISPCIATVFTRKTDRGRQRERESD